MNILTHDRIDIARTGGVGLLAQTTLLWGGNALQSISVTRNTPRAPQQAVGFLGVVDYTRGVVTSEVTLDTILTEASDGASVIGAEPSTAVNRYAALNVDMNTEKYAMTSFALSAAAGQPITCNYGWITAGLASYLKSKAQPAASAGLDYAVVLGDEGLGVILVPTWTTGHTTQSITILDATGNSTTTIDDQGLPAGVQNLSISANINRDQVLDVRTSRPIQFVTTYPVRITATMEVYELPGTTAPNTTPPAWNALTALALATNTGTAKTYVRITGLAKQSETETVNVGRYLSYNVNFEGSEVYMPIATQAVPS